MSRAEVVESIILIAAIFVVFWPKILGFHHSLWDMAMYASLPVILWVGFRRWRRIREAIRSQKEQQDRERETGSPAP